MWSFNTLKCLMDGHVSSAFTYQGTEYRYCVRCGHINGKMNGIIGSPEGACSPKVKNGQSAETAGI